MKGVALACLVGLGPALAGCGSTSSSIGSALGGPAREPLLSAEEQAAQQRGSLFGEGGLVLFGGNRADQPGEAGIGVNSFLWRASLDTVSFMPIASADPFGGVILTDWHSLAASPDERFKVNIHILDRQLRSDGVRAAVFRQVRDGSGSWTDAPVAPGTAAALEETILTRARELRVGQAPQ